MDPDKRLHQLADAQFGLVRTDQLEMVGLSSTQLHDRTRAGVLEWLSPRVLRVVGAPVTNWQRAIAATFDAGDDTAVSHLSAAAVFRVPGYTITPVHVTRADERNKRPSNLGIVHEPKLLLPEHLVRRGALLVTTGTRTLFDLASMVHVDRLARAVDAMMVRRYTNPMALHEMLRVLAKRGRTGITAMRDVLRERPPGYRPPESHLEARVQRIITDAGLPCPERQVDLGDDDGWIARVDFLCRHLNLVLFVDGDFWHSALTDRAGDAAQQQRLERAGFQVERIAETTVFFDPHSIPRLIRAYERGLRPTQPVSAGAW
jgi:very-short-patch-repair endonuclease